MAGLAKFPAQLMFKDRLEPRLMSADLSPLSNDVVFKVSICSHGLSLPKDSFQQTWGRWLLTHIPSSNCLSALVAPEQPIKVIREDCFLFVTVGQSIAINTLQFSIRALNIEIHQFLVCSLPSCANRITHEVVALCDV